LGARRVIAVERDERCVAALQELAPRFGDRLRVVAGDAMQVDLASYVQGAPARVVANLPYNIATALLVSWLTVEPWPPWYDMLVLTFQREVAQRIVADPGTKAYGRLSVLAGWRTTAQILFDIAPRAFVPAPQVISSVVRLMPRAQPLPCNRRLLEPAGEAPFGQRRKTLRQRLKSLGPDAPAPFTAP